MWRHEDGRDDWAMRILGAWLRDWRLAAGATQRELGRLAGVDQAHICRIERGQRRPSGIPLARLLIALDWLSTGRRGSGPWDRRDAEPPPRSVRWGPDRPPVVLGPEPVRTAPSVDPARLLDALLGGGPLAVAETPEPLDPTPRPDPDDTRATDDRTGRVPDEQAA